MKNKRYELKIYDEKQGKYVVFDNLRKCYITSPINEYDSKELIEQLLYQRKLIKWRIINRYQQLSIFD